MTAYYKIVDGDGFISGFGTNGSDSATAITEEDYNSLTTMFSNRPTAEEGHAYILRDNPREWVLIEVPIVPEEVDPEEALSILLGGEEE